MSIEQILNERFPESGSIVEVRFIGDNCGEKLSVKVVSEAFRGLSKIQRHRLIHTALETELRDKIHSITIVAKTAEEN